MDIYRKKENLKKTSPWVISVLIFLEAFIPENNGFLQKTNQDCDFKWTFSERSVSLIDSQRYPYKLCLIKYESQIIFNHDFSSNRKSLRNYQNQPFLDLKLFYFSHNLSNKCFKGTVVNRSLSFMHAAWRFTWNYMHSAFNPTKL